MTEKSPAFIPPDGGWGWLVCFAAFWVQGTIFGIVNCFGVIYVKLEETFGEDAFVRSWVGSICCGMVFLMSPVASILTDKLGIKQTALLGGFLATAGMLLSSFVTQLNTLCLTYGVILGTGASLCYTPSLVILGHYFHRHMGLVNGIVTSGSSVFTVVLPFFIKYLNTMPFGRVFQILSIMMGALMICALTFRPLVSNNPADKDAEDIKQKSELACCSRIWQNIINVTIWKNKRYLFWVLSIPTGLFGYFVPYFHLVKHVENILKIDNGGVLITCIGLTSGVGRIIAGKVGDHPRVNRICLQQISLLCIGILTMFLVLPNHFIPLIAICLFMGFFDGCFISLIGPIAFDLVGQKSASQAIGFLLGLTSIPLMTGPPIAGKLYDHFGNYTVAFIAAGVSPIVGAALMSVIHRISQNPDKQKKETNKESLEKEGTYGINSKFRGMHEEIYGINGVTISETVQKQNWNTA